jgi:L-threonylcarbamoyladenylate synthase
MSEKTPIFNPPSSPFSKGGGVSKRGPGPEIHPYRIFRVREILRDEGKRGLIVDDLKNGKIMIYPTETVYGIGCDAFNEAAVNKIFEIKKRPLSKSLILLIRNIEMIKELTVEITPIAEQLIKAFWPGPLTMIFKAKPGISKLLTGKTGTIALRQSPYPLITSIFGDFHHPLVSTSANISNDKISTTIDEIATNITDNVDLIIDGGKISSVPSTVIDVTDNRIVYVREGAIKKTSIERLLYGRNKTV